MNDATHGHATADIRRVRTRTSAVLPEVPSAVSHAGNLQIWRELVQVVTHHHLRHHRQTSPRSDPLRLFFSALQNRSPKGVNAQQMRAIAYARRQGTPLGPKARSCSRSSIVIFQRAMEQGFILHRRGDYQTIGLLQLKLAKLSARDHRNEAC